MAGILVIGIGNPDRGDDAIGLVVAREVGALAPWDVGVIEHRGDSADLVDLLGKTAAAVLVDAAISGAEPGTIRRIDVHRERLPAAWFACSTHGLGLATAIELAATLSQLPRHCIVYAVEGRTFDHGAELSDGARTAIPTVTAAIARDLTAFQYDAEPRHA